MLCTIKEYGRLARPEALDEVSAQKRLSYVDHAHMRSCSVEVSTGLKRDVVWKLAIESHEPVHNDMASLLTPRQLTRLSCPCSVPTRSPRRVSQTWYCQWCREKMVMTPRTLHSKSSYPANNNLPDTENATDVIPHTGSGIYTSVSVQ